MLAGDTRLSDTDVRQSQRRPGRDVHEGAHEGTTLEHHHVAVGHAGVGEEGKSWKQRKSGFGDGLGAGHLLRVGAQLGGIGLQASNGAGLVLGNNPGLSECSQLLVQRSQQRSPGFAPIFRLAIPVVGHGVEIGGRATHVVKLFACAFREVGGGRGANVEPGALKIENGQDVEHKGVDVVGFGDFVELDAERSELGIERVGIFFACWAVTGKAGVTDVGGDFTSGVQGSQTASAHGSGEFGLGKAEEGLFNKDEGAFSDVSSGDCMASKAVVICDLEGEFLGCLDAG